jgi:hypothetical protein
MLWRKLMVAAVGALTLVGAGAVSVGAHEGGNLIEFDSMTPVGHPPVTERGIPGGGAAWSIISASGEVDRQGHVAVTVHGLIVVQAGINPINTFQVAVSCLNPAGVVTNVVTTGAPASMAGDSTINATVDLPHPCKDPVIFVGGSPRGSFIWFAMSNAEDDD